MSTFLRREENHAIAVLSQKTGEYDVMQETRLVMKRTYAQLIRFCEDAKSKSFRLSAAEADTFCEAWLAFRAEQQAASQEGEQQRRAEVRAEAYAIAKGYSAIQVVERGNPVYWLISCPKADWASEQPAMTEDELLRDVKEARERYRQLLIPRILPPNGGDAA